MLTAGVDLMINDLNLDAVEGLKAAAIVKVMGGVTDQPLLTREQMVVKETETG